MWKWFTSGSWRTTLFGVFTLMAVLGAVGKALLDGDPETNPNWSELMAAFAGLFAGLGLMSARDNKVTSEQAGAK